MQIHIISDYGNSMTVYIIEDDETYIKSGSADVMYKLLAMMRDCNMLNSTTPM